MRGPTPRFSPAAQWVVGFGCVLQRAQIATCGVTSILDPDSTFENMIDLRDAIDANIVQGPRMSCGCVCPDHRRRGTAGQLINDEGTTGYYMAVNSKDEIVKEVRRQIKYGADWIKVHVTGIIPAKRIRASSAFGRWTS